MLYNYNINNNSSIFFTNSLLSNIKDNNLLIEIGFMIIIFLCLKIITTKNPMLSIVYLIGVFILISISLIYINLSIMALLYLLVYVGAIAILFLFILSLLNLNYSELKSNTIFKELILISLGSIILFSLIKNIFYNYKNYNDWFYYLNILKIENYNINSLPIIKELNWNILNELNELQTFGLILYTESSFLFLFLSLILLLTIIGAISLISYRNFNIKSINN